MAKWKLGSSWASEASDAPGNLWCQCSHVNISGRLHQFISQLVQLQIYELFTTYRFAARGKCKLWSEIWMCCITLSHFQWRQAIILTMLVLKLCNLNENKHVDLSLPCVRHIICLFFPQMNVSLYTQHLMFTLIFLKTAPVSLLFTPQKIAG